MFRHNLPCWHYSTEASCLLITMIAIWLLWFTLLAPVRHPTTILMTTCWMLDRVTGCAASLPSYYYDYYMITILLLCYCYESRCWLLCDVWQQFHDNLLNFGLHEWLWSVLADHFAQWVAVKRPCWLFCCSTGCEARSILSEIYIK